MYVRHVRLAAEWLSRLGGAVMILEVPAFPSLSPVLQTHLRIDMPRFSFMISSLS